MKNKHTLTKRKVNNNLLEKKFLAMTFYNICEKKDRKKGRHRQMAIFASFSLGSTRRSLPFNHALSLLLTVIPEFFTSHIFTSFFKNMFSQSIARPSLLLLIQEKRKTCVTLKMYKSVFFSSLDCQHISQKFPILLLLLMFYY